MNEPYETTKARAVAAVEMFDEKIVLGLYNKSYLTAIITQHLSEERENARKESDDVISRLSDEMRYWKGVVRGARAELHEAGRLSDNEYAELCQDTEARDYVDRIDTLRASNQRLRDAQTKAIELARQLTVECGALGQYSNELAFSNAVQIMQALGIVFPTNEEIREALNRKDGDETCSTLVDSTTGTARESHAPNAQTQVETSNAEPQSDPGASAKPKVQFCTSCNTVLLPTGSGSLYCPNASCVAKTIPGVALIDKPTASKAEAPSEFQYRQWKWVQRTFPGETLDGVIKHLKEEVLELEQSPYDEGELADCLLLLMCAASHACVDLWAAAQAKFIECQSRTWVKTERGWRHDKGAEPTAVSDTGAATPTPETDAAWNGPSMELDQSWKLVAVRMFITCGRLERERDEARRLAASYEALSNECGTEFEGVDEVRDVVRILKDERDTALAKLAAVEGVANAREDACGVLRHNEAEAERELSTERALREKAEAQCAAMREALQKIHFLGAKSTKDRSDITFAWQTAEAALSTYAGTALLERLAKAEADSARLDWMEKCNVGLAVGYYDKSNGQPFRAAIDAAMEKV